MLDQNSAVSQGQTKHLLAAVEVGVIILLAFAQATFVDKLVGTLVDKLVVRSRVELEPLERLVDSDDGVRQCSCWELERLKQNHNLQPWGLRRKGWRSTGGYPGDTAR